jgi:hypothetical protein
MTVDPLDVPASSTHNLRFSYTTATRAGQTLRIRIDVPPGWTAPKAVPPALTTDQGAVSVDCRSCAQRDAYRVSVTDHEIAVIFLLAKVVQENSPAVIITYGNATAPGSAGPVRFDASEQQAARASSVGTTSPRVAFDPEPVVTVTCADGTGTVSVSPDHVRTASTSKLTFTYTPAGGCDLVDGAVSLIVPAGWMRPSDRRGTAGYVYSDLGPNSVRISGTTMTVSGVTLAAGQPLSITYNKARAPATATTSTFVASEESAAAGSLTPLLVAPQVTVRPATTATSPPPSTATATHTPKGSSSTTSSVSAPTLTPTPAVTPTPRLNSAGTMTVSPSTVTAGHPSPLTFTYRAPASGLPPSGEVTLTVPPGWTAPSATPGAPGYASATPGAAVVSGRQIEVTGVNLAPGEPLTISYRPKAVPQAAGNSVFDASERPSTAAVLTALVNPPSVAIAGPSPFHIPATVGFILLAAACAATLATIRFLRHRRRPPAPPTPTLNTVPHAGPPGSVTVEPSRTEATHTMRIEPHPAAAVTTIEESRL